jgi:hypothetical protein
MTDRFELAHQAMEQCVEPAFAFRIALPQGRTRLARNAASGVHLAGVGKLL